MVSWRNFELIGLETGLGKYVFKVCLPIMIMVFHRRPQDAQRAVQFINVSSGGHQEPWDATVASLNLACEYVSKRLNVPMQAMHKNRDIYLQKRVFKKVDEFSTLILDIRVDNTHRETNRLNQTNQY